MKRVALIIAALGLITSGRVYAAEEKSETKMEQKADSKGSESTVERSSSDAAGSHDEKAEAHHKKMSNGKVETKKHMKHSDKAAGKMRAKKSETTEKTVRDANGNVVEHEKKTNQ
jgi:hypothetical protein